MVKIYFLVRTSSETSQRLHERVSQPSGWIPTSPFGRRTMHWGKFAATASSSSTSSTSSDLTLSTFASFLDFLSFFFFSIIKFLSCNSCCCCCANDLPLNELIHIGLMRAESFPSIMAANALTSDEFMFAKDPLKTEHAWLAKWYGLSASNDSRRKVLPFTWNGMWRFCLFVFNGTACTDDGVVDSRIAIKSDDREERIKEFILDCYCKEGLIWAINSFWKVLLKIDRPINFRN